MKAVSNIVAVIGLIAIATTISLIYATYISNTAITATREYNFNSNIRLIQLSSNNVLVKGSITNTGTIGIDTLMIQIRDNTNNICTRSYNVSLTEGEEYPLNDIINCNLSRFKEYPVIITVNNTYTKQVKVSVE